MAAVTHATTQRRRIQVQGMVQGVGFRPFVYGQARRRGLVGFVRNDSQGVTIEVEGPIQALDAFQRALREEPPPLARVDTLATELLPLGHETAFTIAHSQAGAERQTLISPDTTICADCLRELFDPADRRYRYPFINCTNCGPRFTIVQDIPYDRANTTMRRFPLCPACRAEYDDPRNRRFHAQPNACPTCGPRVSLLEPTGQPTACADPIATAAERLAAGAILAIKGLGGYHLACDALNPRAVQHLRQQKHREAKPFALMAPDLETIRRFCQVSEAEAALLQSRRRPIVLLDRRLESPVTPGVAPGVEPGIAPDVAPGYCTLGMMLPYTPLHYLLLDAFAAASDPARPAVLVMTSGNLSDEPIAYQDHEAMARLAPLTVAILTHNRAIHMRCDDSLMRVMADGEQIFRRSRGYAPEPLTLALAAPRPILACGGHLKNTFCLLKGRQAFLSQHIGDLENLETLTAFRAGIEHIQRLFESAPQAVAYDLHPEYLATTYALDLDLPHKIGVQHHHAHIASVLAEHGLAGPVIGLAADGTGYGTDGAVWGCELLAADLLGFERLAHLAYVPLPGGEQAVRQPWRMTAAHLAQAYGPAFLDLELPFVRQFDRAKWRTLAQMIARGLNSPPTSSLGRLFDAVAALLGLRSEAVYEGQAAIELEMLAASSQETANSREWESNHLYPFAISAGTPAQLDVAPMLQAIVRDLQQRVLLPQIASRFHHSIAAMLAAACVDARQRTALNVVALSGGVFQNRLLLELLRAHLKQHAFQVYLNQRVPPNDGGLSLGQAAVAAARLQNG